MAASISPRTSTATTPSWTGPSRKGGWQAEISVELRPHKRALAPLIPDDPAPLQTIQRRFKVCRERQPGTSFASVMGGGYEQRLNRNTLNNSFSGRCHVRLNPNLVRMNTAALLVALSLASPVAAQ